MWGETALTKGCAARRFLGYVGHEPGLYLELGARRNLALFARLYGLDAPEQRVVDAFLASAAGAILFPRLTWLASGTVVRRFGGRLSSSGLTWPVDFFLLIVPGAMLGYLIYVANVG
jgi:hypothetical protein